MSLCVSTELHTAYVDCGILQKVIALVVGIILTGNLNRDSHDLSCIIDFIKE